MDYILSPCSMAAEGLARMMTCGQRRPVLLQHQTQERLSLQLTSEVGRIVVFLPDDPYWLLFILKEAAFLLAEAETPLPMLILSRSPSA